METKTKTHLRFWIIAIISFIIIGSILAIPTLLNSEDEITSLSTPILKGLPETSGNRFVLQGVGYPKAKVLIYINEEFTSETVVNTDGNFNTNLVIPKGGETSIKVKQVYRNIESDFSESQNVYVDITPPDPKTFSLTTTVPTESNSKSIVFNGRISELDKLYINEKPYKINADGSFNINYSFSEGTNIVSFKIADNWGNKTEVIKSFNVYVDTSAPKLTSSSFERCDGTSNSTEEVVNLRIDQWSGYLDATNSVPIVGCVSGNISSITIDGKKISWDENKEIYQRIKLYISGGLNKYKVVVTDKAGNKSTGYVETTSVKDNDSIDVNLNY